MFKVKYLLVKVTKGPMTKITTSLPQWEAQVVVALWGEEAEVVGETYKVRDLPEVNDEFARLANKYGPRDEEIPVVAKVYGSFGPGLQSLEREFQASIIQGEAKVAEAVVETKVTGDVEPGQVLPGSDETFGPDATPEVKDDVPFYAGNPELEEAMAAAEVEKSDADFTDLTGEAGEGGDIPPAAA